MKSRAVEVGGVHSRRASYESISWRTGAQNHRRSPMTLSEMFPSLLWRSFCMNMSAFYLPFA